MDAAKNFAKGTLSQGYDDTATSIVLNSGDGARFPAVPFNAVWWNSTDFPDPADDPSVEIVRVTAKSTDTFTVSRGHEGTGSEGVAGFDHQLEGKVYKLIAPLTARVINEQMLNVSRDGADVFITETGVMNVQAPTIVLLGHLGNDQLSSGSTLGTVILKLPWYDDVGDLVGYIPIYNSIT